LAATVCHRENPDRTSVRSEACDVSIGAQRFEKMERLSFINPRAAVKCDTLLAFKIVAVILNDSNSSLWLGQ
jgi:hypothetical protein